MSMSTNKAKAVMEGDLQIVPLTDKPSSTSSLPPKPMSMSMVEYTRPLFQEKEEYLLNRILDNVSVRVCNTSGSSSCSGSGDFHQYRQMRRKEQDRIARMEVDYQSRKEVAEFEIRRAERLKATEERTDKKRVKRRKIKQRNKVKRSNLDPIKEGDEKEEYSDGSEVTDKEQAGGCLTL